jgi:hypothetical protein
MQEQTCNIKELSTIRSDIKSLPILKLNSWLEVSKLTVNSRRTRSAAWKGRFGGRTPSLAPTAVQVARRDLPRGTVDSVAACDRGATAKGLRHLSPAPPPRAASSGSNDSLLLGTLQHASRAVMRSPARLATQGRRCCRLRLLPRHATAAAGPSGRRCCRRRRSIRRATLDVDVVSAATDQLLFLRHPSTVTAPPRAPPSPSSTSTLLELPLPAGINGLCGMREGIRLSAASACGTSLSFPQGGLFVHGEGEHCRS